jgi:hypothetical protein
MPQNGDRAQTSAEYSLLGTLPPEAPQPVMGKLIFPRATDKETKALGGEVN